MGFELWWIQTRLEHQCLKRYTQPWMPDTKGIQIGNTMCLGLCAVRTAWAWSPGMSHIKCFMPGVNGPGAHGVPAKR